MKELAASAVKSHDHNSSDIYSSGVKEVLHAEVEVSTHSCNNFSEIEGEV